MVSANWHCAGIPGEVRKFAAIDVHAYVNTLPVTLQIPNLP